MSSTPLWQDRCTTPATGDVDFVLIWRSYRPSGRRQDREIHARCAVRGLRYTPPRCPGSTALPLRSLLAGWDDLGPRRLGCRRDASACCSVSPATCTEGALSDRRSIPSRTRRLDQISECHSLSRRTRDRSAATGGCSASLAGTQQVRPWMLALGSLPRDGLPERLQPPIAARNRPREVRQNNSGTRRPSEPDDKTVLERISDVRTSPRRTGATIRGNSSSTQRAQRPARVSANQNLLQPDARTQSDTATSRVGADKRRPDSHCQTRARPALPRRDVQHRARVRRSAPNDGTLRRRTTIVMSDSGSPRRKVREMQ